MSTRTNPQRGIFVRLSEEEMELVRKASELKSSNSPTTFARESVIRRAVRVYERWLEEGGKDGP